MQTVRISLPGIDALEASPDPRDYSLLADSDNILIKEHSRGSGTGNATINHNIGYIPFYLVYCQVAGTALNSAKYTGTAANDGGYGTIPWVNPTNAQTSNDSRASATWPSSGSPISSNYLNCQNFGFAIPTGSLILGVEVIKEGHYTGSGAGASRARLIKGGTVTGDIKDANFPITTDALVTQGSSTDMWGITLTPAEVNASNFGVALYTDLSTSSGITINIDSVNVKVYYSLPRFRLVNAANPFGGGPQVYSTTTDLVIANNAGLQYQYYNFYDNMT